MEARIKLIIFFLFISIIGSAQIWPFKGTSKFISPDYQDTILINGRSLKGVDTLELNGIKYTSLSGNNILRNQIFNPSSIDLRDYNEVYYNRYQQTGEMTIATPTNFQQGSEFSVTINTNGDSIYMPSNWYKANDDYNSTLSSGVYTLMAWNFDSTFFQYNIWSLVVPLQQLDTPVLASLIPIDNSSMSIEWTDVNTSPNEDSIQIQYDTVNTFNSSLLASIYAPQDSTIDTLISLLDTTIYFVRVKALGDGVTSSNSEWSNILSDTTFDSGGGGGWLTDIVWTNLSGAIADGNNLTVTTSGGGGTSTSSFSGDSILYQYEVVKADTLHQIVTGVDISSTLVSSFGDIDYYIYINTDDQYYPQNTASGEYAQDGDIVRFIVRGSTYYWEYYRGSSWTEIYNASYSDATRYVQVKSVVNGSRLLSNGQRK